MFTSIKYWKNIFGIITKSDLSSIILEQYSVIDIKMKLSYRLFNSHEQQMLTSGTKLLACS